MNSSSNIYANISIVKRFGICRTYRTIVEEVADADRFTAPKAAVMLLTMMLVKTGRRRRRLRRRSAAPAGRRPVVEAASSRAERFPKTLFALSRTGSERRAVPETCCPVRRRTGWSRLRWRRKARDWQNLDWFWGYVQRPRRVPFIVRFGKPSS